MTLRYQEIQRRALGAQVLKQVIKINSAWYSLNTEDEGLKNKWSNSELEDWSD
jgi:hypothetical protein